MHSSVISLFALASVAFAAPRPQEINYTEEPRRVGDGNPHQKYFYRQLTHSNKCNGGDCSISRIDSESLSMSFGFGGATDPGFFHADFTVSQTVTVGQSPNCGNANPGDTVCVFWRQGYTSYEVQTWSTLYTSDDYDSPVGEPYVLTSPNDKGIGSGYECARNDECHHLDYEFWGASTDSNAAKGPPNRYEDNWKDQRWM